MGGGPETKPEHLLFILPFPEPTGILERIKKNHPQIDITYRNLSFVNFEDGMKELPKELFQKVTILCTLTAIPAAPEDAPKLELVHFISAGTNHVQNSPIYTETSIPLTTSSGMYLRLRQRIHGPQIAEWVIMTTLCHSHSYNLLHHWQQQHAWGKAKSHHNESLRSVHDLVGQRIGILGYGSIGRQVARVASAMGSTVLAYTASPRPTLESKKDRGFIVPGTGDPDGSIPAEWYSGLDKASLHNFLSQDLDHLLVSVPLTKETNHFLAAPEFAILSKRNAFVSNISRGQIINQDDLIDSLRQYAKDTLDGKEVHDRRGLKGAALDVTDPEPLPKESPLWSAPNCIVTPHISGLGSAYLDRAMQVLEVNLKRREKGEKMINVVNRDKGY